jgi:LDH2 family malate/lactate/ureidoglycolate dehydrogenase
MVIPVEQVRELARGALQRIGVPEGHARLQADLLIEAELCGRPSHGLLRLNRVIERIRNGVTDPGALGKHRWRGAALLEVDGCRGLGPVVACAALDQICARAAETGIALAAISNSNHLGMLAWYAERVTAQGFCVVALTTSEALVHPWGGRKALVGTNPILIGIPASPEPFILDMATSLVSMGQIHDYALQARELPRDWALDAEGRPTTDPNAAKGGSIAPFGGAKGYALGLAFEVLVSSLTQAAIGPEVRGTLDSVEPCTKGDLFIVINTVAGSDASRRVAGYLQAIRECPPADGFSSVSVPGDRSRACRTQRLRDGLPLADHVWQQLQTLSGSAQI